MRKEFEYSIRSCCVSVLLSEGLGSLAKLLKDGSMFGGVDQVSEFVRIVFEVVKKFVVGLLIGVAGILEASPTNAQPGHGILGVLVFTEEVVAPDCWWRVVFDDRFEAGTLIAGGDFHLGPIEKGGG